MIKLISSIFTFFAQCFQSLVLGIMVFILKKIILPKIVDAAVGIAAVIIAYHGIYLLTDNEDAAFSVTMLVLVVVIGVLRTPRILRSALIQAINPFRKK